jgi:hypothetical protein
LNVFFCSIFERKKKHLKRTRREKLEDVLEIMRQAVGVKKVTNFHSTSIFNSYFSSLSFSSFEFLKENVMKNLKSYDYYDDDDDDETSYLS